MDSDQIRITALETELLVAVEAMVEYIDSGEPVPEEWRSDVATARAVIRKAHGERRSPSRRLRPVTG